MQKIEIEFKNEFVKIYLIVKEKNLDKTLLNTNIISNEKLLFSLDYIKKNENHNVVFECSNDEAKCNKKVSEFYELLYKTFK